MDNELLRDLKIHIEDETKIFCDNQSTISVAHNPIQDDVMKHVDIDRHWIRETLDKYKIITPYVGSSEQLVEILTKGVSKDQFVKVSGKLWLIDIHSLA